MLQQVSFSAFQGFKDIESFYALLHSAIEDEQVSNLHLNFSSMTFLVPEALLAILCGARVWYRAKDTALSVQFHQDVLPYIERTGYFTAASDFIRATQPTREKWSKSGSYNLLEITRLPFDPAANSRAVYETYTRLEDILLGRVKPSQTRSIISLTSEVIQNIPHSHDQGFVMAQVYQTGATHRVHIGIVDAGLGIPTTLRTKYPNIGTDAEYLHHALEAGITSREESAGLGLFTIQRIVHGSSGSLTMRSGTGMLQYRNGMFQLYDNLVDFPGTQLYITIWGNHANSDWSYALT